MKKSHKVFLWTLAGLLLASIATVAILTHTTYRLYAVRTESMSPTIPSSSLVLVKVGEFHAGQVITFHHGADIVTHRYIGDNADGSITTKGDGVDTADATTTAPADVIGGVIASRADLGYWWIYFTNPFGLGMVVLTILLAYLFWDVFSDVLSVSSTDDASAEAPIPATA